MLIFIEAPPRGDISPAPGMYDDLLVIDKSPMLMLNVFVLFMSVNPN